MTGSGARSVHSFALALGDDDRFRPQMRARASSGTSLGGVRLHQGREYFRGRGFYPTKDHLQAAVVKIRYRNGMGSASAHARYVGKPGKGLDGGDPEFFDKEKEGVNGLAEVQRWKEEGDVRWWKLPVSPENPLDGPEAYRDMIRYMMANAEQDLGTKLEWVAATHYDAAEKGGKVHTHVIIRGRDEQGDPLAIHPDYIMNGFRTHVREFLTYDSRFGLGERTPEEIQRAKERSLEIREMREEGLEMVNLARETGTITREHAAQMEKMMKTGSVQEIELILGNIRHEVDRDQERLRERSKGLGMDIGY